MIQTIITAVKPSFTKGKGIAVKTPTSPKIAQIGRVFGDSWPPIHELIYVEATAPRMGEVIVTTMK